MPNKSITVQAMINAPIAKVWQAWNDPEQIKQWAFASADWEAPAAKNDLRVGGMFTTTMAAKDGSAKFDFNGTYTKVDQDERIEYTIEDGRKVSVLFESKGDKTKVVETFEMESINSEELQRAGWQAILDNFKKHVEAS